MMDEKIPLISVVVPIYSTEEYLNSCIESITNQTYSNLEIILVDDGSPDGCSSMCDRWLMRDNRIKVVHKPNGGAADAKNYGLLIFSGDYLAIVDSDDWIRQDMYEKLFSILSEYSADIVDSLATKVYDRNAMTSGKIQEPRIYEYDAEGALSEYLNDRTIRQTPWNKIYSRKVVDGVYFVKGKYIDDEYWTYRVIDKCSKYVFTTESFYYYYQRSNSAMGNAYSLRRLDAIDAFEERYHLLRGKYPKLEKRFLESYLGSCKFHYQMLCYYHWLDQNDAIKNTLLQRIKKYDYRVLKTMYHGKKRVWFVLFLTAPKITCKIRNVFKIGW